MDIPASHVYEVLESKSVTALHHANSVATACQFIRSNSLLSRGTADRMGLVQTAQKSDDSDRRYGIWFDVFLDSVDIHARARRANNYGPVLLVTEPKILQQPYIGRLWVTRLNPTKWAGKADKDRWFQGRDDLESNFVVGEFDQMVVARHCGGQLPFKNYLKEIVLDDPGIELENGCDVFSLAYGALLLAMQESTRKVPIVRRQCPDGCTCSDYWNDDHERLKLMFEPSQRP